MSSIPLTLITGFLGAGKTTLLRHIASQYPEKRLVFLVNEFSSVDVDAAVLSGDAEDVVELPGGSIFCTCLVSEFIRVLKTIPERFPDMEALVVEASGIANPKVVRSMFEDTGLDQQYVLASVLAVIDPGTFPTLLQTLPNIRTQVEAADLAVLNKVDCFEEEVLQEVEAQIREIQPAIELQRVEYGRVEWDFLTVRGGTVVEGEYAACVDPNFAQLFVIPPAPVDCDALVKAFRELGWDLYRAKGFLKNAQGWVYFDMTMTEFRMTPALVLPEKPGLALIMHGTALKAAMALQQRIQKGGFSI